MELNFILNHVLSYKITACDCNTMLGHHTKHKLYTWRGKRSQSSRANFKGILPCVTVLRISYRDTVFQGADVVGVRELDN